MDEVKVLITGANGFVGPYAARALRARFGDRLTIAATSRLSGHDPDLGDIAELDITDRLAVEEAIQRFGPTHVLHLAGVAALKDVVADPPRAWQVHLHGNLTIANAIMEYAPACVLLAVGTGLVYGASARRGEALRETTLLDPTNGYEVTKAAGDLAIGALAFEGLRCIRLRPFNHTGAGQTDSFAAPSFALQIARIEVGLQPAVMRVGNLDAERDFLDVRDVASAYALAVEKAHELPRGVIINIASGVPRPIRDVLDGLIALSRVPVRVELDPSRMRPSDLPHVVGDNSVARELLGWKPNFTFEQTLADLLDYCRGIVTSDARA